MSRPLLSFALLPVLLAACGGNVGIGGTSTRTPPPDDAPAAALLPSSPTTSAPDPLMPDLVSFTSGSLTLHGFLYRPLGSGLFPAIVLNHGSEQLPGAKRGQAMFYVNHGFVLFVPHRRGQGRSADAGASIRGTDPTSPAFSDALVAQSDDVMAAIAYVASLPYVDAKRVAVSGCSLGGIESLLAAARGAGIVAAIDFAGASATWANNPALQQRMKTAARNARVPVFFLQAENDYDTTPSRALAGEMKTVGKPVRVHVFPLSGTTHEAGHAFCTGGESPPWGNEVLAFLKETMGTVPR